MSTRITTTPAITPTSAGTANHVVAVGRCNAATTTTPPSNTSNALPSGRRRSTMPRIAANTIITVPIDTNNASLSLLPNRRIASSFNACGVWSTTAAPIA
ncbi:hypothetical protein [Nocardia colli]|uniref:hypothetical protein n=1 Tax=Nocardia colli TaxID=2545717 RepID=UPI00168CB95B|nr:hypothetical protein [Nocardia colli]